jgi:hypothetical protein
MAGQSEEHGLSQGLAMLDAIAPRGVWEAFAAEGKRRAHLEKINQSLSDLDDITQSARAGELVAGDTFRHYRRCYGQGAGWGQGDGERDAGGASGGA